MKRSCLTPTRPFASVVTLVLFFGAILVVRPSHVLAGACCAGGAVLPALITDDSYSKVAVTATTGSVIGDAPVTGQAIFRASDDDENTQILRLESAILLSDRFQVGVVTPIVRRSRVANGSSGNATGLGDVAISTGYEILPEWTYSVWRPHGHVFAQILFPTGGSIYDSFVSSVGDSDSESAPSAENTADLLGLNARGKGFYTLSLGTILQKNWGKWDVLLIGELRQPFTRTYTDQSDGSELKVIPSLGGSATFGVGVSPVSSLPFHLGLSAGPDTNGPIRTEGLIDSKSVSQLVWNASLQVAYSIGDHWTSTLAYNDQTLIGPAHNVTLNRAIALSFQMRWNR